VEKEWPNIEFLQLMVPHEARLIEGERGSEYELDKQFWMPWKLYTWCLQLSGPAGEVCYMRPIPHDSQPDSTSYTLYSGETPVSGWVVEQGGWKAQMMAEWEDDASPYGDEVPGDYWQKQVEKLRDFAHKHSCWSGFCCCSCSRVQCLVQSMVCEQQRVWVCECVH
jgi:hypothetical protein